MSAALIFCERRQSNARQERKYKYYYFLWHIEHEGHPSQEFPQLQEPLPFFRSRCILKIIPAINAKTIAPTIIVPQFWAKKSSIISPWLSYELTLILDFELLFTRRFSLSL